jgi:heme-degrading monooxygenase HmoA
MTNKNIFEFVILNIIPNKGDEFEKNFNSIGEILSLANGYISHNFKKCIESQNRYMLLVEWETLEDHTERFMKSEVYPSLLALILPFQAVPPLVEHYL